MVRRAEAPPLELEMWGVLDQAIDQIPRRLPGIDADAMRVSMTLHVAASVVTMDLRSRVQQHTQVTPSQLNVLLFTLIHGELELHRITRYANMKKATASALVNAMVNDGLLHRRSPPNDRRTLLFSLTDRGMAVFDEAFQTHNQRESVWVSALDPQEQDTLVRLLVKLVDSGVRSE